MSLVAQYLFKDNANDELGNYNGTLATGATFENTPSEHNFKGKALVNNNLSSAMSLVFPNSVIGTTARSFEFWGFISSFRTDYHQYFFGYGGGNSTAGRQYVLDARHPDSGNPSPYLLTTSTNTDFNRNLSLNEWHHYVLTKPLNGTNGDVDLYLDGVKLPKSIVGWATILDTYNDNGSILGNLNGKIANFRIYDDVLPLETIQDHYSQEISPPPSLINYLHHKYARDRRPSLMTQDVF